MFKRADGEKSIRENMKRDVDLLSEVPNASFFHQQKPLLVGSSGNRVSLPSTEYSSSASSSFSNGFYSSDDGPQSSAPLFEEARHQTPTYHYYDGFYLDSKSSSDDHNSNGKLVDELGLSQNICRMGIGEEHGENAKMKAFQNPDGAGSGFGSSLCESMQYNFGRYGSDDGFNNRGVSTEGFQARYSSDGGFGADIESLQPGYGSDIGFNTNIGGVQSGSVADGGVKNGVFNIGGFQSSPSRVSLSYNDDIKCNANTFNGLQSRYGSDGGFNNGVFDIGGLQSSPSGVPLSIVDDVRCNAFNGLHGEVGMGVYNQMGSLLAYKQSNYLCLGSSWYNNQSEHILEQKLQGNGWNYEGIQLQSPLSARTNINDSNDSIGSEEYKMDSNASRVFINGNQFMHPEVDLNVCSQLYKSLMLKEMTRAMVNNGIARSPISAKAAGDIEGFSCEDSIIIQGKSLNHFSDKGSDPLRGNKKNSHNKISVQNLLGKNIKLDDCATHGGVSENDQRLSSHGYSPLPELSSFSSFCQVPGYIYSLAQDQYGCRFLQKIFEVGTSQDIQIIFNEIIDHVAELMLKPFGNYVIQKLLEFCNEEQRSQIVLMVIEERGQLVRTCLNTYGTRVVQKLIETLKTRQQIMSIVLALEPSFLDLMKDQNGNHVIQQCLQCLSNEDNKFIFDAAAKFCVEIATHRHGCCVMQWCIASSVGKYRHKLTNKISRNALLLAQDPFGNYVVQFVIELKIPSTIPNLLAQFKGHYIHLSTQKFSSHVVEKCLKHFEESRSQIVRELLSVPHFEQLLQDPFANYVIQSALSCTKGPLHSALVEAVRPHTILRTSPYCKRIFSRNILKK